MPTFTEIDHYRYFVQDQMTPGKFASAEFVAIGAGPPMLSNLSGGAQICYPIGMAQNFSLGQNMALARIFELGSKRSYFFPGKVIGGVTFGRPYYHGPSLLRILYAAYRFSGGPITGEIPSLVDSGNLPYQEVHVAPGYENFFVNLASDLFSQPIGLLVLMRDSHRKVIQSFFLEQCYVPAYNLAVDAQGLIWQEAVSVQYERLVPVRVQGMVPLDRQALQAAGQKMSENVKPLANL